MEENFMEGVYISLRRFGSGYSYEPLLSLLSKMGVSFLGSCDLDSYSEIYFERAQREELLVRE
jgi:hypothetical protein